MKRFGELPTTVIEQINVASLEQVEQWFDCAIDARSLNDVLGSHLQH